MKRLWNMICILALANLLALGGFAGWLGMTDRLSLDRLKKIREVLVATNAQEREVAEQKVKDEAKAAADEAEQQRLEGPPESSAERIARQKSADDSQVQSRLRMEREINDLRRTLQTERESLDAEKAALAAERKKFDETRAEAEKRTSDVQFKQALATLEAQKPKDAHAVLKALIDGRKEDQAIAYLSAMDDRARSKVMAEFIKADDRLAAGLLEQLRLRGVTAPMQADAAQP